MPFRNDRERRACFAKMNSSVPRVSRTTVGSRKKEDDDEEVDEEDLEDED